jgi:protein tyrosine phosphatase (PTP) superfamily phosphohydrolase (DUF442 family)
VSTEEITNFIRVDERIATAGQPTADQLASAAAEGYTAVVNLGMLDPRYALPDEAGLVRSLGMAYHHVPVVWEEPRESDFEAFERAMASLRSLPDGKVLIHCAANFRVTAFYSLYAQKHLGWTDAQAAALRARIWKDRREPPWDDLIARIRSRIAP